MLGIAEISPLLRRRSPAQKIGKKKDAPVGALILVQSMVIILTQVCLENGVVKFAVYAPQAKRCYGVLVKFKSTVF